jgi:hypothetical protein
VGNKNFVSYGQAIKTEKKWRWRCEREKLKALQCFWYKEEENK